METLGTIIKNLLGNDFRLNEALRLEKLKSSWPQVADSKMKVQPYDYKNKVLFLAADSAVWAQQAVFFKQTIIDKYKVLNPAIEIKDIRIKSTGFVAERPVQVMEMPVVPDTAAPQDKLERIIRKAQYWARQDKRPGCPVCGRKFTGTGKICISCITARNNKEENLVVRYLEEAPWARYEDIRLDLPSIGEDRFRQIRRDLTARTLDSLRRLYFDYYLEPIPERLRPRARQWVSKYVMLKTGLTPDKIDDNIISNQLRRKLYKFIYG